MCVTMHGLWGANISFFKQMLRKDYESALCKQAPLSHYRTGISFKMQIPVFFLFLLISGLICGQYFSVSKALEGFHFSRNRV